jgi:hypothetical protein
MTRNVLQQELATLTKQREQLLANLNGCLGAIALCERLIAKAPPPRSVTRTTAHD